MDKVIGKVTVKQEAILEGGHHIVSALRLAEGLENLSAGMILYRAADGWRPLPANYTAEKPAAVLLEEVKGPASGAVASAALHGAVRNSKAVFANGAPATMNAADDLRSAGIYLLGDPIPSALAPLIVADLANKSVTVGDALTLSFLAAAQDEGIITRQWYSNSSASAAGGAAIEGATGENYAVNTAAAGTKYFYCVATNRLNNTEAAVTSAACTVVIAAA
ncbi:MAG: hypothetical protein LBS37_06695 [Treponema sp.]|jgi:hypothetical protein|nr:hypothetical protein [Treponema sp.]